MTDRIKERIEGASGPSRELDAWIETEARRLQAYAVGLDDKTRAHWRIVGFKGEISDGHTSYYVPLYTSSLDAALALVEVLLPGWYWMTGCAPGRGFFAELQDDVREASGYAATPPLALLSALLTALKDSNNG